jgi:hypothetical protein
MVTLSRRISTEVPQPEERVWQHGEEKCQELGPKAAVMRKPE